MGAGATDGERLSRLCGDAKAGMATSVDVADERIQAKHITQNLAEGSSRQMYRSPETEDTRSSSRFSQCPIEHTCLPRRPSDE